MAALIACRNHRQKVLSVMQCDRGGGGGNGGDTPATGLYSKTKWISTWRLTMASAPQWQFRLVAKLSLHASHSVITNHGLQRIIFTFSIYHVRKTTINIMNSCMAHKSYKFPLHLWGQFESRRQTRIVMGAIVMTFNDLTVNYFCTFFFSSFNIIIIIVLGIARLLTRPVRFDSRENISQMNWNWTVIIVFSSTVLHRD